MSRITFTFDKEKDLWNNWDKCNKILPWKNSPQGNFSLIELCKEKSFEEIHDKLEEYFRELHQSGFIQIQIKTIEESWEKIEIEFFKRMNHLFKKDYNKKITAYLTTSGICPYDPVEPSFMFSLSYSLLKCLANCGHEIMHLYFHEFYWEKIEKEIGAHKTGDLKEALTVLLNLEFKDLWFIEDAGYDSHKELRNFISEAWGKEKNFNNLIDKCIKYLK